MVTVVFDDQQPSTSAAALADLNRSNQEEEIQMDNLGETVRIHTGSRNEDSEADYSAERSRYFREALPPFSRDSTHFLFAITIVLPLLKIIACVTVLSVDIEMDHLCRVKECDHLVYSPISAIYFLVCLIFLILGISHVFIGLQIFIRTPDTRCLLVLNNITVKMIRTSMHCFAIITGFEIIVIVTAAFFSHPGLEITIPCFLVIAAEVVAYLCFLSHPKTITGTIRELINKCWGRSTSLYNRRYR